MSRARYESPVGPSPSDAVAAQGGTFGAGTSGSRPEVVDDGGRAGPGNQRRQRLVRLGVAALILVTLWWIADAMGITGSLSPEGVKELVAGAGAWGVLVYVVAFTMGELVQLPGWVFIGAGTLAYGQINGFLVAMAGASVSVAVGFASVRWAGGQPLATVRQRHVAWMLRHLDRHPVGVIFLLRLVFWVSPPLTYALALTQVRFRDYLLGSVVGMIAPVFALTYFFDWLQQYL